MQIVYAHEPLPELINKSIMLCGPTPRNEAGNPWRIEAIKILDSLGFDGVVYIPEPRDGIWANDYNGQVEWEELCLNQADCIVFWIPRELDTMPGFTTNIEWGRWEASGKLVLGSPYHTPKMSYIEHYAHKLKISNSSTLEDTLQQATNFIGDGVERSGGSRMIPLYIWETPSFQSWYQAQIGAGNRLDDARVLYTFRPRNGQFVFLWILKVDIYIASENRHKTNEFVIARTDISSVVMWHKNQSDLEIVLVKEFRSPASTSDGFIRELPGGSTKSNMSFSNVAASEIHEETGLLLDSSRLKFHSAKQLAGTFSSHKAHIYLIELTDEEITFLKNQKDIAHGIIDDSEQTYIEVVSIKDILYGDIQLDWATLGMILTITNGL